MGWEQRLREMVLAGGAFATAGCSSSAAGNASDASTTMPGDSTAGGDAADVTDAPVGPNFCCNGNPDPCCPQHFCDAGPSMGCNQEIACLAEGGTWDMVSEDCSPADGGAGDGALTDGGVDSGGD